MSDKPAKRECPVCKATRTLLMALLLGGASGYAAIRLGLSANAQMLATFFGALLPVVWMYRKR